MWIVPTQTYSPNLNFKTREVLTEFPAGSLLKKSVETSHYSGLCVANFTLTIKKPFVAIITTLVV